MSVPYTQLVSTTYDAVVKDKNKAANQWAESAFLRALEKKGAVKIIPGGNSLSLTLDYRANPGADFLATDTTATSTDKTEVITQANYSWATLVVPVNWTFTDEILNSSSNAKIDLVAAEVANMLASHDQAIEDALFASAATDGFESLRTITTEDGTGTVGSIVAGTETWWKNQFKDYDAGATLLADMRTLYNACAKGSGGSEPDIIVGGSTEYGLYEGKLVANQRYVDDTVAMGSFTALKFANASVVYSSEAAGHDSFYFINSRFAKIYVAQGGWRQRREPLDHVAAAMVNQKLVSVCQFATNNRSRLGVLFT